MARTRTTRRTAPLGIGLVLAGLVAAGLWAAGSGQLGGSGRGTEADRLWSARTPYVGNASRVVEVLGESGLGAADRYTVELQTDGAPFGVTVTFQRPDTPLDGAAVHRATPLVLGLVGNLDHVTFVAGDGRRTTGAAQASAQLGYDVKTLGRDRDALERYLQAVPG